MVRTQGTRKGPRHLSQPLLPLQNIDILRKTYLCSFLSAVPRTPSIEEYQWQNSPSLFTFHSRLLFPLLEREGRRLRCIHLRLNWRNWVNGSSPLRLPISFLLDQMRQMNL